jgi:dGTPase
MRDSGGFEGNGQTLRLLARLEAHTVNFGLDLCRRTLLGVLKYPVPYSKVSGHASGERQLDFRRASNWKPPKCSHDEEQEVVDWICSPFSQGDRDLRAKINPPDNDDMPPHKRGI